MPRPLLAPFAALLVAAAAPAQAPEVRLLRADDLYKADAPRDVTIAPDGKSAVYVRGWIDGTAERSSLWRADGAAAPKPLEAGEPDARSPVFSPDGKWVAFVSTRPRPEGWAQTEAAPPYSDPAADVWLVPAAGGKAVPLAGPKKPYGRAFHDTFYGRLAFSPDSKRLAFVAEAAGGGKPGDPEVVRPDQGEGYTGYHPAQLWVAHLRAEPGESAAETIARLTDDDVWYADPQWSPDGTTLVAVANKTADRESARYSINKNFDLWAVDVATKTQRRLTDNPGPDVSPRVSPDGKRVAYLSSPRNGPHRDAYNPTVLDLADGAKPRAVYDFHADPTAKPPFPEPTVPLPHACWRADGRLLVDTSEGVRAKLVAVDPAAGSAEPAGSDAAAARKRFNLPGDRMLTGVVLGEQQAVRWTSTDGFAVEGVLTLPPAAAKVKPPYKLVVHPHGGPHGRIAFGFDFTVQVYAANGYAVFQPNFRGSTGYGLKFLDADRGDFGGGDMRDILSGVDHLIKEGIADKDRLFLTGTSYGGFMTTWLVGQTPRFKAAVAINPVTDLTMMWSLSDLQSWTEWEFGGKPWEVPDKMRKHSPLTYADKVTTPTLLLHSRDDRRCPLPMGRAYHRALLSRGVPTGLVIYPDENHGIRQPKHREDVLRRTLEWFAKYDK